MKSFSLSAIFNNRRKSAPLQNEKLLSLLLENTDEIIVMIDAAQNVIYRSPSATRISGWTDEEAKQPGILTTTTHPDDIEKLAGYLDEVTRHPGKTVHTLLRTMHKEGYYMYMEGSVRNMLHIPAVAAIIFNVRNVTERVLKEQELFQSRQKVIEREQQLQLYVEHSPAAIAMFDNDLRFIVASHRWMVDYHLEGKEITGKTLEEVFPQLPQKWKDLYRRSLNGSVEKNEEDAIVRADGSITWLRWEIRPWFTAGGSIGGAITFTENITERKVAAAKVEADEERYRLLLESISDGFVALDNNWQFTYANKMSEHFFGHPASYLKGKNIWEVFPKAVGGPFYRAYQQAMETQEHIQFIDYSVYAKLWLHTNVYPTPSGLTVFFTDITRQIEAQETAKQLEETRRLIMSSALDAIVCITMEGIINFWNPQAEQLFGWTAGEAIGLPLKDTIIPVQYQEEHLAGFTSYQQTGTGTVMNKLIEITAVNKKGTPFPIELFIVEVKQTAAPLFCAFIRDISERKKREKEIIETNERLKRAQEIAQLGSVEMDFETNNSIWSEEACRIYGLENGKRSLSPGEWVETIHPDDLAFVKEMVAKTRNSGSSVSFHHRIIRKNGETRHILSNGKFTYHENGHPKSMHGIVHDITEIKKLEQELLEQQQREQMRITAAIIEAEEKERNAIGEELHDNVNQILTGIFLQLSRVKNRQLEAATIVDTSMVYLKKAIEENRKISKELIIPDFVSSSLTSQLENLTAYMLEGAGIRITVDTSTFDEQLLDEKQKLIAYRVLQEQCTNIIKYAHAATVNVRITTVDGNFRMTVADDGIGMDPSAVSNGIGLRNIKSRLSSVNGNVAISSAPSKGFELDVFFPVRVHAP